MHHLIMFYNRLGTTIVFVLFLYDIVPTGYSDAALAEWWDGVRPLLLCRLNPPSFVVIGLLL